MSFAAIVGIPLRTLLRNWKISAIAILSLAIAMSVSVAGLSISNAVLFRPPVAQNPDRLVTIHSVSKTGENESLSYPDYQYFRDHARLFSGVAAFNSGISKYVATNGEHREFVWESVSDNYFSVMGIRPFLGQFFAAGDEQKKTGAAVITYSCWQRWGADPRIIGKTVKLNSRTLTIIGVGPKEFTGAVFGFAADVIIPLAIAGRDITSRDYRWVLLVARTNRGVTRPQVRAEVKGLWEQLAKTYPEAEKDRAVAAIDATILPPDSITTARQLSAILIATVLQILFVACANVANLLLALATRRRQEALIKVALGATRFRLMAEFLKESALLCAFSGVLGYLLAVVALQWGSQIDATIPVYGTFHLALDLRPGVLVLTLTLGLIALATFASGFAPALYASTPNLATAISGEAVVGGTRKGVIRNAIVVVQVAICTLALVGVGLCYRSVQSLRHVDPGFSARNLIELMITPEFEHLSREQQVHFYDDLRRRAAAVAGVEAVTLADQMPLSGGEPEGVYFPDLPGNEKFMIGHGVVDDRYFSTLGIRLLSGRTFNPFDLEKDQEVIVINRYMAEKFWPHLDPLGKAVRIANGSRLVKVVGVVADGKYEDLDEDPRPYFYYALSQHQQPVVTLIARTSGDPELWIEPISHMARGLGLPLPLPPSTFENHLELTLFFPRFILDCVSGLSALALLLATLGLYGAISYSISERRKEIGIRVALGARPPQLFELVLRRTLAIAGAGVAAGLLLGVLASSMVVSLLYGIHPVQWNVLLPVGAGMIAVSVLIAYIAARPWIHMDAMDAVRHA